MLEKLIKIILAIFLVLDLYQKLFITLILKIKQSTVSLHMQSIMMKSAVEDDIFNVRIESENGNYEGEASQVLVLLSNYYADKNYLMKIQMDMEIS